MRQALTLSMLLLGLLTAAAAAGEALEGVVLDDAGRPIEAARVVALHGGGEARSDAAGRFRLDRPGQPMVLEVSHPAFAAVTVEVERAEEPVKVRMIPTPTFEENLVVEGEPLGQRLSPRSLTATTVEPAGRMVPPATLSDAVAEVAGVSENGQGGLFQVVSLRGISRQRVLSLISGARITSERRAGVATSFVDPSLVADVDVFRGPATTYYGAGALGGALVIRPRHFESLSAGLGYESQGDANRQSFGWGRRSFSLGLAHRAGHGSETADREPLFDAFDQWSATLQGTFGGDRHSSRVLLLGSYGSDIEKPNTDYPERATLYPRERHLLLRYGTQTSSWHARLFVHGQDLVTEVAEPAADTLNRVENGATDFGALWERELASGEHLEGRIGVDYFGRRGVDVTERIGPLLGGDVVGREVRSLEDGEQDELAALAVANWRWSGGRLEAGLRGTWLRQASSGAEGIDESHLTGFVGAAIPLRPHFELVANVGRGLRVASLSERFFIGTTGRGQVIGNPDLAPESSLSAELGLRFTGRRLFVTGAVFRNRIDDYIERLELAPDTLTFRNLTAGTLTGLELQGFLQLDRRFRLSYGGHHIDGEGEDGARLADVPPNRLNLGVRFQGKRLRVATEMAWRGEIDDPGPGEKPIPQALLLEAGLGYEVLAGLELTLSGENLLDEVYFPSADDRASLATGRSLGVGLVWKP